MYVCAYLFVSVCNFRNRFAQKSKNKSITVQKKSSATCCFILFIFNFRLTLERTHTHTSPLISSTCSATGLFSQQILFSDIAVLATEMGNGRNNVINCNTQTHYKQSIPRNNSTLTHFYFFIQGNHLTNFSLYLQSFPFHISVLTACQSNKMQLVDWIWPCPCLKVSQNISCKFEADPDKID